MIARGDERAVSALIGAVLLLGILVTALALYQVNVVPQENAEVEFNHNERAHGEMQAVRNAIGNTGNDQISRSTSIQLGTQYPDRWVTINPPNPAGTVETTDRRLVTLENAQLRESNSEMESLLNDFEEGIETTTLTYEPSYNAYQNAPKTHIEHSALFNDFEDTQVDLIGQGLIQGPDGKITLTVVDGEVSQTSSGTTTLDITHMSGPTTEIPIESENGNIELEIPTEQPNYWVDTIGNSFSTGVENARINDAAIDEDDNSVTIELDENERYTLIVARVSVDGSADDGGQFDLAAGSGGEGPAVTDVRVDDGGETEVEAGDNVNLEADFSSQTSTEDFPEAETPIVNAKWYVEDEEGNRVIDVQPFSEINDGGGFADDRYLEASGTDAIDTGGFADGEYTVFVRAQNSRGVWTDMTAIGEATIVVGDGEDENGDGDEPGDGATFDQLQAEEGGNLNQIDYDYVLAEDSSVTRIEFRGYVGNSTDGEPDGENVIEIESEDDRSGGDRINMGGQTQDSSTIEVRSFENGVEIEQCVGMLTSDSNSISLEDGTITCS